MFKGKWFFIALAAFSGTLFILESNLFTFLFVLLCFIRMLTEKSAKLLVVYVSVLIVCMVISLIHINANISTFNAGKVYIPITFQQFPHIDGNSLRATVTSNKEKLQLIYTLETEKEKIQLESFLRFGLTCMVDGELVKPEQNRNVNAFNYQTYLERQKIHWLLRVDTFYLSSCHSDQSIMPKIINLRQLGINKIEKNFPKELIPYVQALIFGDRFLFPEDSFQAYQRIGVVHLLAISGLHVGIIVGFLYYCLIRVGFTKESVYWFLVSFLPIYCIIAGSNPPVLRAAIMTILLLSARRWNFSLTTLDALAISFILFILLNPYNLYHIGFQLSFSVSLALIMTAKNWQRFESYLKKMLAISMTSLIASIPIVSFHFYEFSLISVFTNVVFVPFYSIFVLPTFLIMWFIQFWDIPFTTISRIVAKIITASEIIAQRISNWEHAVLVTGRPEPIILILLIVAVILFFMIYERKGKWLLALTPLTFVLMINFLIVHYSPKGEVIFIDVGQGDSILIRLPYNNGTYLIDTGGHIAFTDEEWKSRNRQFTVGNNIVIPLLKSKGISKIDKLILTHADFDHIGATNEILDALLVKKLYISPQSYIKPTMEGIVLKAKKKGIPVIETVAGTSWQNRSGQFQFIYPFDSEYVGNNDSLVLYARFGGLTWLFMGDVEAEGEKELLSEYKLIKADVLKVGHHGSRTSTTIEFIDVVDPKIAIISAGENNRFGHPHQEVIDILERSNIITLRTDLHGAIHYEFFANDGTFWTIR